MTNLPSFFHFNPRTLEFPGSSGSSQPVYPSAGSSPPPSFPLWGAIGNGSPQRSSGQTRGVSRRRGWGLTDLPSSVPTPALLLSCQRLWEGWLEQVVSTPHPPHSLSVSQSKETGRASGAKISHSPISSIPTRSSEPPRLACLMKIAMLESFLMNLLTMKWGGRLRMGESSTVSLQATVYLLESVTPRSWCVLG